MQMAKTKCSNLWPVWAALLVYIVTYIGRITSNLDDLILLPLKSGVAGWTGDVLALAIRLGMSPLVASLPVLVFGKPISSILQTAIALIGLSAVIEPVLNYTHNVQLFGKGLDFSTVVLNVVAILAGGTVLLVVVLVLVLLRVLVSQLMERR